MTQILRSIDHVDWWSAVSAVSAVQKAKWNNTRNINRKSHQRILSFCFSIFPSSSIVLFRYQPCEERDVYGKRIEKKKQYENKKKWRFEFFFMMKREMMQKWKKIFYRGELISHTFLQKIRIAKVTSPSSSSPNRESMTSFSNSIRMAPSSISINIRHIKARVGIVQWQSLLWTVIVILLGIHYDHTHQRVPTGWIKRII